MQKARLAIVVLLTLLPWPLVWLGMYHLHSLVWTFFLYHGVCLLPAILIFNRLWRTHIKLPTRKQWLILLAASVVAVGLGLLAYLDMATMILSKQQVLAVLTERGFHAAYLLPFSAYFVIVNATCEELFWRGVVLNELELVSKRFRRIGTLWTAFTFAAWHWLVLRALLKPGWAELGVLAVVLIGIFSSELYRKTNSIVLPVLWHGLVFDLAIIAMFAALLHGY